MDEKNEVKEELSKVEGRPYGNIQNNRKIDFMLNVDES